MLLLLLSSYCALIFQDPHPLRTVNVVIKVEEVAVRQILVDLEHQSDYRFFYASDLFDTRRKMSMNFRGNLEEAIKIIFDDQLTYTINNKQIVLKSRPPIPEAIKVSAPSPEVHRRAISGIIRDESNLTLPGVNIIVKGSTVGSASDAEGRYTIEVPDDDAILSFSFIGYKTQEASIRDSVNMDVVLEADNAQLEEVVVIGYGSVKKSDLTGSVSTISKKEIGDRQVSELAYLIQGRATGVDVTDGTIRIRGVNSFNNTDPLIVIDGFIGGNLQSLNANDIENIEILKDASSTAIYGARGSNGVILITTKTGKSGPLVVNVKYYEGVSLAPKKLDVMNANQYTDYALEVLHNSSIAPTDKLLSGYTRVDRTDWQDVVFATSHNRELNLDFSGGADQASYFLSTGYRHTENPTFMGRKDDYIFVNNRNTFKIRKWIKAGMNLSLAYNTYGGGGSGNPGNLIDNLTSATYIPVYDEAGNPSVTDRNTDITEFGNPVTTAINNHFEGANLNYQSSLWSEIEPLQGLTYKVVAGVSGNFGRDQFSNDTYTGGIAGTATLPAQLTKVFFYRVSPLVEQYLTYNKTIADHQFSIMVGHTWQNGSKSGQIGVRGTDYDPQIPTVMSAKTNLVLGDAISRYAYLSYYARGTYQFRNKYLLAINFRSDASPKFPPANRWGSFPSVAAAWKLHEESFLQSSPFDQLKLRMGWGISGNDAIGDFQYLSKVYTTNVYYPFGPDGHRVNGATVLNGAASNLKWESTETKSVGVDMTVFQGKLTLTADYYIKQTRDILYEVPRALSMGYGSNNTNGGVIENAARLRNRGVELQLGYRSSLGKLFYTGTFLYTHNVNKVTSLGDGIYLDGINRTEVGFPLGYFYGHVADGIFMTQQQVNDANELARSKGFANYQLATTQAGDVRFKDINGDGHIDNDDRTKMGNAHPTELFGFNGNLSYQGFDMNFLFQGISGSSIYGDDSYDRLRGGTSIRNQSVYVLDRWVDEAHPGNGIVPRAVLGDPAQNNRPSTLKVSDGAYLKLKQISLGYTLKTTLCKQFGLSKMRVYVSAYNVVTWTPYKYDYDPEIGGVNLQRGIDNYGFPRPKMLMAGFQVSF